jgi:hypothetical protein
MRPKIPAKPAPECNLFPCHIKQSFDDASPAAGDPAPRIELINGPESWIVVHRNRPDREEEHHTPTSGIGSDNKPAPLARYVPQTRNS